MSDTCPNCGAPPMGRDHACVGLGGMKYACEYAASLRTERDKYKQQRDHWRGLAEDANRQAE